MITSGTVFIRPFILFAFSIFAIMKKWASLYSFFFLCIGSVLFSKAAVIKPVHRESAPSSFHSAPVIRQLVAIPGEQAKEGTQPQQFCRSLVNCTSSYLLTPFKDEQNLVQWSPLNTAGIALQRMMTIKHYLRHLFPSHYFW